MLYGLGSITFITAVFNTSTANLVFILAFTTMFSALLSWIFLKERPRPVTLVAMAVMIVGVLIIVGDWHRHRQHLFGDSMALCSAFLIAAAITIIARQRQGHGLHRADRRHLPVRRRGVHGLADRVRVDAPWWIIFNGAVVMPISFFCLANGPRYISGPEVAMFYLLETVLAPVWVWMIFAETPSRNSLIGGAILIVTLVAHSLWQIAEGRKRRAATAVRPSGLSDARLPAT